MLCILFVDPRPRSETLEEYLLLRKKKKKKKKPHMHHKAVQTVTPDPPSHHLLPLPLKLLPFLSHQDISIRRSHLNTGSWTGHFLHEELQANGGGSVLHAYGDELSFLDAAEIDIFAQEFLKLAFSEKPRGAALYALAVVHGAAHFLPDFLDYFAFNFPNTPVKMEILGKKDIETTTIANFHSQVGEDKITCYTNPLLHVSSSTCVPSSSSTCVPSSSCLFYINMCPLFK